MTVVPPWQREQADDQPFKIQFFFYVVDDDRVRSEYISSKGGLIAVPKAIVERLKDDSELAAVLADGAAFIIQQQGTKVLMEQRVALGMEAASLALIAFSPAVALDLAVSGAMPNTKEQAQIEEQRGRIALALLADAGYNPWKHRRPGACSTQNVLPPTRPS
jgi:predicted Zn-dependent protease